MKKVLVAYVTHSGTTRDVAQAIAEEIAKTGHESIALPLEEIKDLSDYAAVVLGAPMIVGWHRAALKFLNVRKDELVQKPLALFFTAMSLTDAPKPDLPGLELHVDARLASAPRNPNRLSFKERFSTLQNYLAPVLKQAPASLAAVGFFGGRLDFYRLKWYEAAFVMLVIGAKPGEKRNWPDIRAWAAALPALLKLE